MKQPVKADKSFTERAASWCAYQERSQYTLRKQLRLWGCSADETEDILARMITEGYINEERFAKAYAGGKFRMKQWGKVKIREGLRQHNITNRCIESGLAEIPEDTYRLTLESLAAKKWKTTSGFVAKRKADIARYLTGKGYEHPLVWEVLEGFSS